MPKRLGVVIATFLAVACGTPSVGALNNINDSGPPTGSLRGALEQLTRSVLYECGAADPGGFGASGGGIKAAGTGSGAAEANMRDTSRGGRCSLTTTKQCGI